MDLFEIALAGCEHLIVAVTNPDSGARHQEATSAHRHTAAANPFTYFERSRLLRAALDDRGWARRCTIVPFDLTRRALWAEYVPLAARHYVRAFSDWERQKARWMEAAGYQVEVIDGDPLTRLSASDIRAGMRDGRSEWRQVVPSAILPLVDEFLAQTPIGQRW